MIATHPPVSIVLATRDGGVFLQSQLQSICAQTVSNWHIILSDDGSRDDTLDIARRTIPAPQLRILEGPKKGLALNFWNGLMQVPEGHCAAFCDQDDVWMPDKLARALAHLGTADFAVYSAGRHITDNALNILKTQPRSPAKSFKRLFFKNAIAGHTCLLSPSAVTLLKRFPPTTDVPFHDWWAALVLSTQGATFIHDPNPVLYYRQHDQNVIGARGGRIKTIVTGRYFRWLWANLRSLLTHSTDLAARRRTHLRICLPFKAGLSRKAK